MQIRSKIKQYQVSKSATRCSLNDLTQIYDVIISTIETETEKHSINFKKSLICDILLFSFARAFPIFDEIEKRFVEESDIQLDLEKNLRPRLETYFLNIYIKMEKEMWASY